MRYCFLRYPQGKYKALTLSYDDGVKHDKKLIEIANKHGLCVTLNINSARLSDSDDGDCLSVQTLKELVSTGNHEIAIHGAEHIALGKATPAVGIHEVIECRKTLEQKFGGVIRGMAYADSGIRSVTENTSFDEIETYLKMLGVAYARTLGGDNDNFSIPNDFYAWMPTAHHGNPKVFEYLKKFVSYELPSYIASRTSKLFYLWGHSYEFANENNWELFEKICQTAGGHDDIWYATNIEICDYVRAYHSLQFSIDRTAVYNPTDKEIWFEIDKKLFSIASGQTLAIYML